MAPPHSVRNEGLSPRPFVDYFWIAGLDGDELFEAYKAQTLLLDSSNSHSIPADSWTLHTPIHEDEVASSTQKHNAQRNSYDRLSKLSSEASRSIRSTECSNNIHSNRSSATITQLTTTPPQSPGFRASTVLTDVDFENALKKFSSDRDTFLSLDLKPEEDVSAKSSPAKSRLRTQRITPDDLDTVPNRALGTVRRHMSFREMNSSKRQSAGPRRTSVRASKRISTYNSVIPQPENIQPSPKQHPLKRTFEPVLLDRYPRPEMTAELKRRDKFPDYVPMFAFPSDIQIISSDTRPPTTWHEFSMTAADNSKMPAVCVVVWIPVSRKIADELEKLCEEWRKANLTDAEREMAASVAEKLALERAKLSVLLSKLPQAAQGSDERDQLEEEISTVEERINLMSDMLRPLRHGAANRIEGLTDGDTGLWLPRAYGVIGKDESMAVVWKDWLRAVVVPMMDGAVLRVPPSSPRVGMWQPLERYVFNICCEAQPPESSKVQVELTIRELRLYAKKEADNELPGSRTTDLYPLFRTLTIPNVVILFEYLLAEARIIILSSHVAMLKLVTKALIQLLWPLEWAGVYIPVLPARLMQVLEAPCPYLCGVHRKGEKLILPEDDFVLVDLDKNEIHATEHPPSMPKQQRRKLLSLLYLAASHHHSRGVSVGPPAGAIQAFPNNAFSAGSKYLYSPAAPSMNLAKLASLSSSMFGHQAAVDEIRRTPLLNAFLHFSPSVKGIDRPTTSSTARQPSYPDSDSSPSNSHFVPIPQTPVSRNDSGFALQTSLREKRSGHFDSFSKGSDTFSSMRRKASLPFVKHGPSPSAASLSPMSEGTSMYTSSSYAQSTLAASTIMPGLTFQPARNTETQIWAEGHCLVWHLASGQSSCAVCEEKIEGNLYRCSDCGLLVHGHCSPQITIVCQAAFYPDQIRAAFARFFTSLFYMYKKYISPVDSAQKKLGMTCKINLDAWTRSLTPEHAAYIGMLRDTQAFNEFIAEREQTVSCSSNSVKLFDSLMLAKKGRSGRMRSNIGGIGLGRNPFGRSVSNGPIDFMADTTSHVWRLVPFTIGPSKLDLGASARGQDYHTIITRTPAKLEDGFLAKAATKPRSNTVKEADQIAILKRKMNGLSMNAP